jgi:uncharacterized OsmC-like protein
MDVRAMQEPLKTGYRSDPQSGRITLTARGGQVDQPIGCSIDLGRAQYEAQAHAGVDGEGTGACSGDLLLGALAACAQITCQMVAAAMGLDTRHIAVTAEGDLDLRGTLGVDREAPVGFTDIRLSFAIDATGATAEDLEGLRRRTERYCVVQQTLLHPPAIGTSWSDPGAAQVG